MQGTPDTLLLQNRNFPGSMNYSILMIFLVVLLIFNQSGQADISEPYGDIAKDHLVNLSEKINTRLAGSDEEERAGDYIFQHFTDYGYTPFYQSFSFTDEDGEEQISRNIIAEKEGSHPDTVIIGAHYDSTDDGDGADDNGSGTAILLELAERMAEINTTYSITFIAFGSEENSLDGSRSYVEELGLKERNFLIGFINLDGIIAGNNLYLYGDPDSTLYELMDNAPEKSDFIFLSTDYLVEEDGSLCDCGDFSSFQNAGIPIIFIESADYTEENGEGWTQVDPEFGDDGIIQHTSYDTIRYINTSFPGRIEDRLSTVTRFLVDVLVQKSQ